MSHRPPFPSSSYRAARSAGPGQAPYSPLWILPLSDTAPPHLWCRPVRAAPDRPAAACPGSHSSPCSPRHISGRRAGPSRDCPGRERRIGSRPALPGLKPKSSAALQSIRSRSSSCASGGRGSPGSAGSPAGQTPGSRPGRASIPAFCNRSRAASESAPGCLPVRERRGNGTLAQWKKFSVVVIPLPNQPVHHKGIR